MFSQIKTKIKRRKRSQYSNKKSGTKKLFGFTGLAHRRITQSRRTRRGTQDQGKTFGSFISGLKIDKILTNRPFIRYMGVFITMVLLLSLLLSLVFVGRQYYLFNNPNKTTWNGDTRINILFVGMDDKPNDYSFADLLAVMTIDPQQKRAGVFTVDPDIRFELYGSKDTTLRKAYNLNVNNKKGIENVISGVESVLALRIDKYVMLNEQEFENMKGLVGSISATIPQTIIEKQFIFEGNPLTIEKGKHAFSDGEAIGVMAADEYGLDSKLGVQAEFIQDYILKIGSAKNIVFTLVNLSQLNSVRTNFSKVELARLYYACSKLNSADVRIGYTRQSSLIASDLSNLDFGKNILTENIDKDIQSIFLDQSVVKEQVRLEVLNGTATQGLATKYSRLFTNHGIRLVRTDNSVQPSSDTVLFIEEPSKYPSTVAAIKSAFNGDVKIVEQDYRYKHIGDMVLVLGNSAID